MRHAARRGGRGARRRRTSPRPRSSTTSACATCPAGSGGCASGSAATRRSASPRTRSSARTTSPACSGRTRRSPRRSATTGAAGRATRPCARPPPRSMEVVSVASAFAALTQPRPFRSGAYDARGAADVLVAEAAARARRRDHGEAARPRAARRRRRPAHGCASATSARGHGAGREPARPRRPRRRAARCRLPGSSGRPRRLAQRPPGVDPGGVAVGPLDLDGVVPDRRRSAAARMSAGMVAGSRIFFPVPSSTHPAQGQRSRSRERRGRSPPGPPGQRIRSSPCSVTSMASGGSGSRLLEGDAVEEAHGGCSLAPRGARRQARSGEARRAGRSGPRAA